MTTNSFQPDVEDAGTLWMATFGASVAVQVAERVRLFGSPGLHPSGPRGPDALDAMYDGIVEEACAVADEATAAYLRKRGC